MKATARILTLIILTLIITTCMPACSQETPEQAEARLKQAWKLCSAKMAEIVMRGDRTTRARDDTGRQRADRAIDVAEECMREQGYKVDLRK